MGTLAVSGVNMGEYVGRHDRPGTKQIVGLEAHFMQDGVYTDPLMVSGVTLVKAPKNAPDTTFVKDYGDNHAVINADLPVDEIKWHWGDVAGFYDSNLTAIGVGANQMPQPTSHGASVYGVDDIRNYDPFDTDPTHGYDTSTVYRTGVGKYIVFLNNVLVPSQKSTYTFHGSGTPGGPGGIPPATDVVTVTNTAAGVAGDYHDIWTVRMPWGTLDHTWMSPGNTDDIISVVQDVTLEDYHGGFVVTTEPVMMEAHHEMLTKKVIAETTVNLEISTKLAVKNRTLDQETKNILKDTVIQNFEATLQKVNKGMGHSLPPYETVKTYEGWKSLGLLWPSFGNHATISKLDRFRVTEDNILILPCDFSLISGDMIDAHDAEYMGGTAVGTWRVKVRYDIMDQKFRSPWLYFEVVGD